MSSKESDLRFSVSMEGPKSFTIELFGSMEHIERILERLPQMPSILRVQVTQEMGHLVHLYDHGPLSDKEGEGIDVQGEAGLPIMTITVTETQVADSPYERLRMFKQARLDQLGSREHREAMEGRFDQPNVSKPVITRTDQTLEQFLAEHPHRPSQEELDQGLVEEVAALVCAGEDIEPELLASLDEIIERDKRREELRGLTRMVLEPDVTPRAVDVRESIRMFLEPDVALREADVKESIEQPPPEPGRTPVSSSVRQLFEKILQEQEAKGLQKYGTPLMTFNGREPLLDAMAEAVDLFQYLVQAYQEKTASFPSTEQLAESFGSEE
jgi:hypothetical protein